MTGTTAERNIPLRKTALELMRSGRASANDVARMMGLDRQLVYYWARREGINWKMARARYLAAARQQEEDTR